MSIGNSGRIVIEVEPAVKRALYSALAREGSTLKQWFLQSAEQYLSTASGQLALPLDETADSEEPEVVVASSATSRIRLAEPHKT